MIKQSPSPVYIALAILFILAGSFILVDYGWLAYATFTERPGMTGDMYYYYRVDRIVFAIYNLVIAICAFLVISCLCFYLYTKNRAKLRRALLCFGIFVGVLIVCEIYLSTRFVGKG